MAKQTVSKTRQVVMLYDGVIRFVQQAKQAIKEKRYEDRYNLLLKASEVVVGLQSALDFDSGGDVARQLYDFYTSIETQLMAIHRNNSTSMCDEVIESMKVMRDEWHRIDTLQEMQDEKPSPTATDATEDTAVTATDGEGNGDSPALAAGENVNESGDGISRGIHISV